MEVLANEFFEAFEKVILEYFFSPYLPTLELGFFLRLCKYSTLKLHSASTRKYLVDKLKHAETDGLELF